MTNLKTLKINFQNARSHRSKTTLFLNVCLNSYDIITITEIWLLNGILDTEIIDGHGTWSFGVTVSTQLLVNPLAGGVLVAVHRELTVAPTFYSSAEDVWVTITFKNRDALCWLNSTNAYCICVTLGWRWGISFSQQLSYFWSSDGKLMMEFPNDKYLIVREFNLSGIEWNPSPIGDHSQKSVNYCNGDKTLLLDKINLLNFKQYNGIKIVIDVFWT